MFAQIVGVCTQIVVWKLAETVKETDSVRTSNFVEAELEAKRQLQLSINIHHETPNQRLQPNDVKYFAAR